MRSPRGLLVSLTIAASIGLAGCGQVKDRPDKSVVVREEAASTASNDMGRNLEAIRAFIELYFDGAGASREGLAHLFDRFKDQISKFLSGTKLTPNELIEILFKFDSNRDGKVNPGEIAGGLNQRIPILRWIPDNRTELTYDELRAAVDREYPGAFSGAKGGLANSMFLCDELWAGGNADERVSRTELSSAGLILGMLQGTDFSKPLASAPGMPQDQKLALELLSHKMTQQLFSRYQQLDHQKLPLVDQELEWMQLSLNFYLLDKLIAQYGADSKIALNRLKPAFLAWGYWQEDHWSRAYRFYDNPLQGGDADKAFNIIETFHFLSDLSFADKILANRQYGRNPAYLAEVLTRLFPRAGRELFSRDEYWNASLKGYDSKDLGGNADGRIDGGEMVLALGYARVIENVYATYDKDQNSRLAKDEALPLFREFKITDPRMIDAFYADIGLDGKDPNWWQKLLMFFKGGVKTHPLSPFEFHTRLVKLMPQLTGEQPARQPRRGD